MANEFDTVTLQNVHNLPFEVIYDNKSYGIIQSMEIKRFPRFLAEHALKHLLDQILNGQGVPVNNTAERSKWAAKIVIKEEAVLQAVQLTPEQKLKSQVEELNSGNELDAALEKAKQEDIEVQTEPVSDLVVAEQAQVPMTPVQTVPDPIVTPEPMEVAPEVTTDEVVADPERVKLYDYARNTLQINLEDPKTKQAFEGMSIDQLKTELNYTEE